jgi:hypothetical protein
MAWSLASVLVLIDDEVVADWYSRGGKLRKEDEDVCLLFFIPFQWWVWWGWLVGYGLGCWWLGCWAAAAR